MTDAFRKWTEYKERKLFKENEGQCVSAHNRQVHPHRTFTCPGEFHHPAHHSIFNAKCLCKKKCVPDCHQQGNEGLLSM